MNDDIKPEPIETGEVDEIIVGRVKPHIYAFSTNTIPNYLKVGDTYRPVKVRLDEWRKKYSNLTKKFDEEASVSDDTYFRDYSIHEYLSNSLGKERLKPQDLEDGVYYSNEFFKDASSEDISTAFDDIRNDYSTNSQRYQYYNFNERPTPVVSRYASTGTWTPRPNQEEVIKNFLAAIKKGRTKLLLYAVMRFGKTFTSMCCANEINAKIVLIVSAKADVEEEWRMTIQSADNFKDYDFINSQSLKADNKAIEKILKNNRKAAIFLTLQDLKDKKIKEKHKEVFSNKIDLLLVDETHFGARAEVYGRVLRERKEKADDYIDLNDAMEKIKVLHPRITMHLSGTPYRILMGSEFEKEDIVGFYQASDILDAKTKWDNDHFDDIENQIINPETNKPYQEWDNPYFGFPQMIRFAFTPSKRIRNRLEWLNKNGVKSKFDEIFRPKSVKKDDDDLYKTFVYQEDILDFLRVIDGAQEDDELMSFLDYEKIKDGSMCHHIVFVLPYRASCDAMEKLITDNTESFHNLNEYKIINISGLDGQNRYAVKDVKRIIRESEANGEKTITLTVNRMLTGSTVREWDTMLYLKDTRSPQEYDQATFRLQNQFVVGYESNDNDEIIKIDKKPQTLLIDFSPNRIFAMQEERALFYNANIEKKGKNALIDQISKDISYSPIIILDNNRLRTVEAVDLLSKIDNYSRNRGIYDEAQEIPIDFGLLLDADIRSEIEKQGEFKGRQGFEINNGEDDDSDISEPDEEHSQGVNQTNNTPEETEASNEKDEQKTIERQFKTYYSRILFYSALTDDDVMSLEGVIESVNNNEDNLRIAKNLDLNVSILKKINANMDAFALYKLDNTITRINKLSNDESLTPLERAQIAMRQFDRLSDSEVITPQKICRDVFDMYDIDAIVNIFQNGKSIIDLASKKGEFALAIVDILQENGVNADKYKNNIYSVTTSPIAYEFTRKIYKTLNLNIDNIADSTTSYNLIFDEDVNSVSNWNKKMGEVFNKRGENMKFDAVVGNPPYQLTGGSGGNADAPIYQDFVTIAKKLKPNYYSFIIPSKWFSGGRESLLGPFRKETLNDDRVKRLVVYSNPKDIFENVEVKGGICYYLVDEKYHGDCDYSLFKNGEETRARRKLNEFDILIREPEVSDIVKKVLSSNVIDGNFVESIISNDTPFGISSNPKKAKKKQNAIKVYEESAKGHDTKIFHIENNKRKVEFVSRKDVKKNADRIDDYKVFIPGGYGAGENYPHQILGVPEYGGNNSVCSQSYLSASFNSETEAKNFIKYLRTRFFRVLVLGYKITQSAPKKAYHFVPMQDFTTKSDIPWGKDIGEIEAALYKKYGLDKNDVAYINRTVKVMNSEENG